IRIVICRQCTTNPAKDTKEVAPYRSGGGGREQGAGSREALRFGIARHTARVRNENHSAMRFAGKSRYFLLLAPCPLLLPEPVVLAHLACSSRNSNHGRSAGVVSFGLGCGFSRSAIGWPSSSTAAASSVIVSFFFATRS